MDNHLNAEPELKRYAAHNIHELAKRDPLIKPIYDLVRQYIANADGQEPISDDKAAKLTKWLPEDDIGRPFDDKTVHSYYELGEKVLEVATSPSSNNTTMLKVAKCLRPLFSQDDRTIDMGFDLEEYMDWYFRDTPQQERERRARELITGWRTSSE